MLAFEFAHSFFSKWFTTTKDIRRKCHKHLLVLRASLYVVF